jgi:hypothetical protein
MKRDAARKKDSAEKAPEEEQPVVIVDELAEAIAVDPTFGGARESPKLEQAYRQVILALTQAHQARFRYAPPEDPRELFRQLQEEVILPHEELIGKLVLSIRERQRISPQEEEQILGVADDFVKKVKSIE